MGIIEVQDPVQLGSDSAEQYEQIVMNCSFQASCLDSVLGDIATNIKNKEIS